MKPFRKLVIAGLTLAPCAIFANPAPVETGHLVQDAPTQTMVTNTSPDDSSTPLVSPDAQATSLASVSINQSPSALINQVQSMQQQLRDMQGQLEVQQHKITEMQSQQMQLYQDIDRRIIALASGDKQSAVKTQLPTTVSDTPAASTPATTDSSAAPATPPAANQTDVSKPNLNSASKPSEQEQQAYQQAYDLLLNKQYSQAQMGMADYLRNYPTGAYAANAHYWLGELSLIAGDSNQAMKEFKTVADNYSQSPRMPDAMYKIGIIYFDQQNWSQAQKQFKAVMANYPNSSAAQLAKQHLDTMKSQGNA